MNEVIKIMENNKDYQTQGFIQEVKKTTLQKAIIVTIETPMPYHSTQCLNCKSMCHEKCQLEEIKTDGSTDFVRCTAFNGSMLCSVCKCDYTQHHHSKIKKELVPQVVSYENFEVVKVPVINELKAKKEQFLKADKMRLKIEKELAKIKSEIEAQEKEVTKGYKVIYYLQAYIDSTAMRKLEYEIYRDYIDTQIEVIKTLPNMNQEEKDISIGIYRNSKERYLKHQEIVKKSAAETKSRLRTGENLVVLNFEEQLYLERHKRRAEQNISRKK